MSNKCFLNLVIAAVFIPSFLMGIYLPITDISRELVGYMAYALPIIATLVAGQAVFDDMVDPSVEKKQFTIIVFKQSLIFYICGVACYFLYVTWSHFDKLNCIYDIFLFALSLLMLMTSWVMYKEFKKDNKNPFLRSLLGASFSIASLVILFVKFFQI
jgi:glucose uptake protein GlcU